MAVYSSQTRRQIFVSATWCSRRRVNFERPNLGDGSEFGLAVGSDTFDVRRDANAPTLRLIPRELFFECSHLSGSSSAVIRLLTGAVVSWSMMALSSVLLEMAGTATSWKDAS